MGLAILENGEVFFKQLLISRFCQNMKNKKYLGPKNFEQLKYLYHYTTVIFIFEQWDIPTQLEFCLPKIDPQQHTCNVSKIKFNI